MVAQDRQKARVLGLRQRQLRRRNLAMLAVLGGLAFLFYVITIVKMGGGG